MEKNIINVPKGIRYISDWDDYSLVNFQFPHILNKEITGCGYTEYCLNNNLNVVLCSPRRILLENKHDQHPEPNVLYAKNDNDFIADFDKDITKEKNAISPEEGNNTKENIIKLKQIIENHILGNAIAGKPGGCKILVTYDSFRLVKEVLQKLNRLNDFYIVVDEFQSIFTDSKFKSSTEIEFLTHLRDIQKLCFVSATPMIDKYLDMLDEFKNLPYYEFDWGKEDPGRIIKPQLVVSSCQSVITKAGQIVQSYLNGDFEKYCYKDDTGKICEIESKEAVIYVNSVKNISEIIKRNGLTYENTNVLCSNTPDNQSKIKKAFNLKKEDIGGIGKVPEKGEPHKMFTLCTRTVYLGADFYSTNAKSFILSDANIDSLSVDISLDLPQILGRQRLENNPWKNRAEFYYKLRGKKRKEEDFNKELQEKTKRTQDLLNAYAEVSDSVKHALAENYQYVAKSANYKNDYVAVNTHAGKDLVPVFNNLVMVSEMRSFEIQQVDYKDRFNLFSSIVGGGIQTESNKIECLVAELDTIITFPDKMRFVCEKAKELSGENIERFLNSVPIIFKNYYSSLGPEKCSAVSYRKYMLDNEYKKQLENQEISIKNIIVATFSINSKYTKSFIKEKLKKIYIDHNYKLVPKATDLDEYFELKECLLTDPNTKKRCPGFLIISKKE